MSKATLDRVLEEAVASGDVAGAAAVVVDKGGVVYQGQAGPRRIDDDRPLTPETVYQIHSMTKPITAAGVMQLVEQGRLDLDADCGAAVPALASLEVLEGFDAADRPILRPARSPVTLRRLLTHTAGFVYEQWNADQKKWLAQTGLQRSDYYKDPAVKPPLAFDPGARWEYGINIDWAGKALEAETGQCLEAYLRQNVLEPLGMASTGYIADEAIRARMAGVHQRQRDGRILPVPEFEHPRSPAEAFTGGGGMFSCASDYARFMRMILNEGELDGVRVLKPETVRLMGQNHIGDIEVTGLPTTLPDTTFAFDFYPGQPLRWGLSFMINMDDAPGARRAGTLSWAGLRNTYFWIDPASGLGGALFTQMLPFADPKTLAVYDRFERTVYAAAG